MTLNATEILQKIRQSNALRQRKLYEKHKDRINEFRRNLYKIARQSLKQQNKPSTDEMQNDYVEHDDNNVPLQEPRELNTDKESVKRALQTTDYFKNDATRKSNLGQVNLIFRATNETPLMDWLESAEKAKELIKNILSLKQKNGEPYALSGSQKIFGCILNIIKIMNLQISYETDKIIFNAYRISKLTHELHQFKTTKELKTEKNVKDYDELVKETLKKYTKNSLEYLLVKLYQYATLRDDYSNMILTKDESDLQKNKNYMILPPKSGNASIFIQKHKTKRVNGDIRYTFNEEVTKLIRNYVKIYKIKYNDNLFGNLKDVLQKITNDSGVDKIDGGSRLLRKSSASTMYNKYLKGEATPSDIYQQIRTMAHSPDTHLKNYVFSLKPNA